MFAAGEQELDAFNPAFGDPEFWYAQVGVDRRFTPYGATVVYGEYGEYSNFRQSGTNNNSQADMWGFGVVQKFDSAALDLYASYRYYEFSDDNAANDDQEDFSAILIGSRIKF
jgi:hypothetical protein